MGSLQGKGWRRRAEDGLKYKICNFEIFFMKLATVFGMDWVHFKFNRQYQVNVQLHNLTFQIKADGYASLVELLPEFWNFC